MKCAAGPWYRSEQRPPPKDGTLILGIFAGSGMYLTAWERPLLADDEDDLCWTTGPMTGIEEDPVVWAEVRDYDGEIKEKAWFPCKRYHSIVTVNRIIIVPSRKQVVFDTGEAADVVELPSHIGKVLDEFFSCYVVKEKRNDVCRWSLD